jgi:rhodanese-related sulfurtransferase
MQQLVKTTLGICFAAGLAFSAHAGEAPMEIPGATTVDAEGVITLIETTPDLVILDNRSVADYDAGHIEGAIRLIDTDITGAADIAAHVPSLDSPVLFYCNGLSCGRAANAAEMAVDFGYTNVSYYALGMTEWRELGLPLVSN